MVSRSVPLRWALGHITLVILKLMSSGILFYIYRQHPKYEIVASSDVQDLDKYPCCVEK